MENLDQIDLELLKQLQKNSNITTKELAAMVNLSPTPVYERVRKLEKEGYIKKYMALLDEEKLGRGLIVFCDITLKQHTKEIGNKFVRDIRSIKEVMECYNISGDYDFKLKVLVRDMKDYQDFVINTLGAVENIGSAHSTFVIGTIKQEYGVPF
ncbi:Lrp/AsnC family transcriptional regulator [Zobellia galactanivorans]|uniref:AsnC/Lrp-type transcriptional regulator n=1 Tax=Zobellia galactanivorans (strain DSM 12802 / CCUG 47099 / CIP 106680 / NCIMB 13871 / Dsij) TaxID=63186 RepID=G0L8V5_ZOBGA|nr:MULTISPECIES: Lrp/AsnC family transcriptional regulator [Zobellia]MBU3027221.1 Lrp/AsnC family transcriptional regulator [Zobellia galactanivorans]MDO6807848.1 Lrp/AsnC family transcriptional regulator [Zobellia galactanivorans]OWW24757.1 AsnC family transcriptional regulator [Zobellia sp. OII3]CAZ94194.1 AsnC/Lrp-type transcriptional regulator [Zobellia galactanivorans]